MSYHHVTVLYSFLWPKKYSLCGYIPFCLAFHQIGGHLESFHFPGSASFFFSLGWLGGDEVRCGGHGQQRQTWWSPITVTRTVVSL